jgi:SAM-dependent methyltransferase
MDTPDRIKQTVREKYADIVVRNETTKNNCGCGCNEKTDYSVLSGDYSEVEGYAPEADLGLGCGLPTKYAFIRPGDTVVDLGSGAGNDCFIAVRETGENGRVIGIDMTEEMIKKARQNARQLGYLNIEFHHAEIEDTRLEADSADVVVSNCVFNLAPDKSAAFRETYRILRPGGHFSISDIVTDGELPEALRKEAEMYVGCIAGALTESAYLDIVRETGFQDIRIMARRPTPIPEHITDKFGVTEIMNGPEGTGIYSITVFAKKPTD